MKTTFEPPLIRARLFSLLTVTFTLASSQLVRAANVTWSGAGPDMNWSDAANWSGGTPSGNAVIFTAAAFPGSTNAAGLVNNIVDTSTTITGLTYNNFGATSFHTTLLAPNQTLTVNGTVNVGTNNQTTTAAITGTNCAFTVNNTGGAFNVEGSGATAQTVTFTLPDGINTINVGTLSIAETGGNNGRTANFNLGSGVNTINANNVNLGTGKGSANVQFAGPSGSLTISNAAGTGRAALLLGNGTSGSGASRGQLALAGHPAIIFAGTVILGRLGNTSGNQQGIVTIDHGLFDATSIQMGVIPSSGSLSTGTANSSSLTVGGDPSNFATLIVNSPSGPGGGSFILSGNANASHSSSGTLTINQNGTAQIYCSITNAQVANNTGTLNVNGGTLIMEAATNTVGTADVPLNSVSFTSASVHLRVNGDLATANVYGSAVSASGTTITIDSVAGVLTPRTIPLISYNPGNGDPFSGFSLAPLPAGYTGNLVDNTVNNTVDLSISPNVSIPTLVWRGAVGSVLNGTWDKVTTANWLNGASPSTYVDPDIVRFDDTASNSTVNVSTMVGPGGLALTNNSLNYTFNGFGAITGAVAMVKAGSGSLTLAESGGDNFSLGLMVTGGTVILDNPNSAISGGASVNSGATLQIGNNDANGNLPAGLVAVDGSLVFKRTDNVLLSAAISGSGSLVQQGAGKLTLSTQNQYTGDTQVLQGTLALTVGNAITNSANLGVTGTGLDLSGVTVTTSLNNLGLTNANVTLAINDSITPINIASTLNLGGGLNTINVTSLPPIASYPTVLKLIQSGASLNGTFNISVTLPAGSVGTVGPSGDNTAVLLTLTSGPTGTRPSVLWVGNNNVTATTNWSDRLNWQLPGAPQSSDNVTFSGVGAVGSGPFNSVGDGNGGLNNPGAINNFVDTSFGMGSLTYTNIGSFQNTLLANGAALTVNSNGSLTVGSGSADFGAGATATATIAGMTSTLNVNNTNGTFYVGLGNSGSPTEQAILDLSGLGTLNASVSRFLIGVGSTSQGINIGRAAGTVWLAQTNIITASIAVSGTESSDTGAATVALNVGDDNGNGGMPSFLYLGQSNLIRADALGAGRQKTKGTIVFNPNLTGASAYFRGANHSAVTTWSIGDGVGNSGTATCTGTVDFTTASGGSDGYVDALVGTINVGRAANNTSGGGIATGTLAFDNGIFRATTIFDGYQPTNSSKNGIGTINVGTNATLSVSGNVNLAIATGGTGAGITTGTLNIDGGIVSANSIACGLSGISGASTINLGASGNGGTLTVANTLGSSAAPLTTLSLSGGSLQLSVNGTAGVTNVVATSISISGTTTLNILSVTHGTTGVTYPLISYTGGDPFTGFSLGPLPAGAVGTLVDDSAHSLIGITFTSVPTTPAVINRIDISGITLSLGATNANPNSQFVLLGTTNLAQLAWKPILTNTFDNGGNLNLSTNVINPAVPQEFYKLSQ
jgi:autotransporter-associated beta strand protein